MPGYNNLRVVDCENEVLRSRLASVKAGAQDLIGIVELYMKQAASRNDLYNAKETLKRLLK